jgi:hypothetical protein
MDKRLLPAALAEDVAAPTLRPFLAVHIDFPDPVFAFTGKGEIEFGDAIWIGIEGVASISVIGEGTDGAAAGVKVTLFRVPGEFRDDVVDQAIRGCRYELYLGSLDDDYQTVRAFKKIWKGTLQGYEIDDAGDTLTVSAEGESRAIDQKKPSIKRMNDDYQRRRFNGDRYFEFQATLNEVPVLWAKAKQENV